VSLPSTDQREENQRCGTPCRRTSQATSQGVKLEQHVLETRGSRAITETILSKLRRWPALPCIWCCRRLSRCLHRPSWCRHRPLRWHRYCSIEVKKPLVMRGVDHGGHRSCCMDLHAGLTVDANRHGLLQ
jgi:hypothetical protein